jgi:CO/xanthine dehydrogenase FAD-binding subunit
MFTAVLLALDAKLTIMRPAVETVGLGDFLPVRADLLPGALVTGLEFPLRPRIALEYVSRTPVDKPIVAVAVAQWPSGRTRVAVAGFGSTPLLAMDGTAGDGAELAARNALHDSGDPWASAEYRMDVAATLTRRCLENVAG